MRPEFVNYISTGKTVGIWLEIDGERIFFIKESYFRENLVAGVSENYHEYWCGDRNDASCQRCVGLDMAILVISRTMKGDGNGK